MGELLPLNGGTYYLWKYVPNLAASIIFIVVWFVLSALVAWRMFKTKTWFCSAFLIGCLMELIGFCARAAAFPATDQLMPYIFQGIFLLLPPTLFAATIYMCLGRIIHLVDAAHLSPVRPTKITKIFVSADVATLILQCGSSGLSAMTSDPIYPKIAQAMVLTGLALQLLAFSLFFTVIIVFHRRIKARPTTRSYAVDASWKQKMYMLYGVSCLIIIRSIYRLAEYGTGMDGYLMTHEWSLFVFDTVLMAIATALFLWRYPNNLKPEVDQAVYMENAEGQETVFSKNALVSTSAS